MSTRNRLELTWVGKDQRPRLESRILLDDPTLSYHAPARRSVADQFDNLLIHGDNLLALKALEAEFAGKVKCIFIDPPYNTGSAFTHYDDGLEHSLWLSMMRDRLEILRRLLREDGSIWITIDDRECHYLKVICDEIFGRKNYVSCFIWRKVDSPNDNKVPITPNHDYVLCYAQDSLHFVPRQKQDMSILAAYRAPDSESERAYRDRLLKKNGKNSLRADRPSMYFEIKAPDGSSIYPTHEDGRAARWAMGKNSVQALIDSHSLIWKKRDSGWIPYTREFAPESPSRPWPTIWDDLHTTRQTKSHQKQLLGVSIGEFDTPKPEDLISRILTMTSSPGDLVLDSFAGSGTTGAVAHKMGRRWIMVELGEHAKTHIVPRLRKVIDGTDPGGVTNATDWKGGGGFRFLNLAPSLMQKNAYGHWVISHEYNAEMLAEAVCKHLGFRYQPRAEFWWMMGQSTERDFICVTTASLTHEELRAISDEVGTERTLLICCKAFMARTEAFENLTVQKIPQTILHRCEWGRDDYSLRVASLPEAEIDSAPVSESIPAKPKKQTKPMADLFDPPKDDVS